MGLAPGRYIGVFAVPGPVRMVAFPMNGWQVFYCLEPSEIEVLRADGGVCVWPFGVGPVGIMVIENRHEA